MKTKITLSLVGGLNVLQAVAYSVFASSAVPMMFNVGEEATQLAMLFQYAITPAFFMIGLLLLMSRNFEVGAAKKILLAVIIGYLPVFASFYFMIQSELTSMGIQDFAIDIIMFGLVVFTYIKPR